LSEGLGDEVIDINTYFIILLSDFNKIIRKWPDGDVFYYGKMIRNTVFISSPKTIQSCGQYVGTLLLPWQLVTIDERAGG
jgi:hypothetical protein